MYGMILTAGNLDGDDFSVPENLEDCLCQGLAVCCWLLLHSVYHILVALFQGVTQFYLTMNVHLGRNKTDFLLHRVDVSWEHHYWLLQLYHHEADKHGVPYTLAAKTPISYNKIILL